MNSFDREVLSTVKASPGVGTDWLAREMGVSIGRMSGVMSRLRERGMTVGDNKGSWWFPETPFHTAPCRITNRLYGPVSVEDRLKALPFFNEHQMREALNTPGLQKRVKTAIERRLIDREWRGVAFY